MKRSLLKGKAQYSEPPSPSLDYRTPYNKLLQFKLRRVFSYYNGANRPLQYIVLVFLITASSFRWLPAADAFMTGYRTTTLSADEYNQVAVSLGKQMDLASISLTSSDSTLEDVPQPGDNVGGVEVSRYHIVAVGENISAIASIYDLRSGSIVLANPQLKDTELIAIGERLTIPIADAPDDELAKEYDARKKKLGESIKENAPVSSKTISAAVKASTGGYQMPLLHYTYVSQGFGSGHKAVDLATPPGTAVYATKAGCLISASAGWSGGYGKVLVLNHGDGTSSLYAHLSSFVISKPGTCVVGGALIGYSGNTGNSTGPHLHFEIRKGGTQVNPLKYVH